MAKPYIKPFISFESLAVSTRAASSCSHQAAHAQYECAIEIPEWDGDTIFTEAIDCTWEPDAINVCYHVPAATTNVFDS